jgi:capsular exopolysaccharide synthesis family protein
MNNQIVSDASDPRRVLRPLWTHRYLIVFVVVVATVGTYLYYDHKPKQYNSTTRVFVRASAAEQSLFGALVGEDQRNVVNQATLLVTPPVARAVAQQIHFQGDPQALLGEVSAAPAQDSDFVAITASDRDPRQAAAIANAFAQQFIKIRGAQQRQQTQQALDIAKRQLRTLPAGRANTAQRDELRTRISQLEVSSQLPTGGAEQIDQASAASVPFSPRPKRDAAFAFVFSLLVAIGVAFGLDRLNRRVMSAGELEEIYHAPLLSIVPRGAGSGESTGDDVRLPFPFREAFRSLRVGLELVNVDSPPHVILITSSSTGEGKSTITANLARAYAEAGRRVAVIEADLRRPSLALAFGVEPGPGLTDALAGNASMEEAHRPIVLAAANASTNGGSTGVQLRTGSVTLLPAGPPPPNPVALLGSRQFQAILEDARRDFDIVLIDTPPILVVSDALPIMSAVDAVVVVGRLGDVTRDAARRSEAIIQRVQGAELVGVVANDPANRSGEGASEYYYAGSD